MLELPVVLWVLLSVFLREAARMHSEIRSTLFTLGLFLLLTGPAAAIELVEDHEDIKGPFPDGPSVTATAWNATKTRPTTS